MLSFDFLLNFFVAQCAGEHGPVQRISGFTMLNTTLFSDNNFGANRLANPRRWLLELSPEKDMIKAANIVHVWLYLYFTSNEDCDTVLFTRNPGFAETSWL